MEDTIRLQEIENRQSRFDIRLQEVEAKLGETQKPKGGHRSKYQCSEENVELFSKLVDIRKKLVKQYGTKLNIIFNGSKLEEMIKQKCCCLDDLRNIRGIGQKNIDEFGDFFLHVLKPPEVNPTPSPVAPTASAPAPALASSTPALKKAKSKPKGTWIQICP